MFNGKPCCGWSTCILILSVVMIKHISLFTKAKLELSSTVRTRTFPRVAIGMNEVVLPLQLRSTPISEWSIWASLKF